MAIKPVPAKFKTSDGREFEDEVEAQRHDALINARAEYRTALHKLNRCIAETTRTADGYLFEFGLWTTYHYVTPGYNSMPQLNEVPYLGWNWELNERDDTVEIVTERDTDNRRVTYQVNDLYRDKKKALAAMIEAQKTWLQEREAEINEHAEKVSRGLDPYRS